MTTAISGRLGRRFTAMGAGAALVAAGLSLGVMAPANAASVVTGGATDGFGNPVSGQVDVFRLDTDAGTYEDWTTIYVANNGFIEGALPDGVYKFAFDAGNYTEFYKDKADLASADAVTIAGDAATALGAWTIDQPYVVGNIINAAGKPLNNAQVYAYDAATSSSIGSFTTDEGGSFKIATPAAPVKLAFSADGYAYEYYADKGTLAAADPIAPSSTGASVGTIVLTAGGSVSGQVTSDAGVPLEFVRVDVGFGTDYTDKNGVYLVENVSTGDQVVEFTDPIEEYQDEYYNNAATYAAAAPVAVGADQTVGNINATLTPLPADPSKTVEVTGTVKDSTGALVVGARLIADTTPASASDRKTVDYTYSNRQGVFAFTDLDKVQGENQFKILASASNQGADDAFVLFGSWFGGVQNYEASPAVTITPGTPVGAVDFVLDRAGGIAGSVTGLAGVPLNAAVSLLGPTDGVYARGDVDFKPDSTFESRAVRPGTYKIRFDDYSGFHAGEWWKDEAEVDDAVVVTVKPGQMVGGLNAVLGNNLAAIERPEIPGYPWVGKAITANPGVWNLQTGTDFNYEWLVGSVVVGSGDTFTPTTAQIGDRLTLRVTGENGRLVGAASSGKSVKVGYQPKVKVKIKGGQASFKIKANPVKAKKVKGKVVVKEIVKVKDNGTIKYKKIAKSKIKKGKGTASLSKLKKGKHKLVFFFIGKGKVGSTDVSKKVKVKR